MSEGPFTVTRPDPPITSKILTRYDQLVMTTESRIFKTQHINILQVVCILCVFVIIGLSSITPTQLASKAIEFGEKNAK